VDYGGEDSFFVSDVGGGAFGIADGVGGWQESGVNPAGASLQALARRNMAVLVWCVGFIVNAWLRLFARCFEVSFRIFTCISVRTECLSLT